MGNAFFRPCSETVTEFYFPRGYGPFPWDVRDWRVGDFDRLGEILNQYYCMQRGRAGGAGRISPLLWAGGGGGATMMPMMQEYMGGSGPPPASYMMPGPGTAGYVPMMMPPGMAVMNPNFDLGGYGGGGKRNRFPTMHDLDKMREHVEERLERMHEEYTRRMTEQNAVLFGSEAERKQELYKQRMLKTLQEILPQLSALMQMAQMGGLGGGGLGMGIDPMMGARMQAMGMGGLPGGFGGMNPMTGGGLGGFGGGPGLNPMVGGMDAGLGGLGGGLGGLGGFGGGFGDMDGGAFPRRGRRRTRRSALEYNDDDDDEMGLSFRNRSKGRGPRFGGRGGGGRWSADSDDDGEFLAGGSRSGPRGPGPRPRGGPSGIRFPSFGGGGLGPMPDDDDGGHPARGASSPFASRPSEAPRDPQPGLSRPPSPRRSLFNDSPPPLGGGTRPGRPASVSAEDMPIPVDTASDRPPGFPLFGSSGRRRHFLDDLGIGPSSMAGGASSPLGGGGGLRPPGPEKKVSFEAEAKLSRSRKDEERRGEADAGGSAGPKDLKP